MCNGVLTCKSTEVLFTPFRALELVRNQLPRQLQDHTFHGLKKVPHFFDTNHGGLINDLVYTKRRFFRFLVLFYVPYLTIKSEADNHAEFCVAIHSLKSTLTLHSMSC